MRNEVRNGEIKKSLLFWAKATKVFKAREQKGTRKVGMRSP